MSRGVGILAGLILAAPVCALGAAERAAPNWDASVAIETADVPESRARVEELFALVRNRDSALLSQRLESIISGTAMSQPARDSVLFRFTVGLADFEHIDPAIIERLRTVVPSVFVPHEERSDIGVPLFNIAGAAEGVHRLLLRREARVTGSRALGGPPGEWLDAYLLASGAQRKGYVDALDEAPQPALDGVLDATLERLPGAVELTPVAGKAALLLGDAGALTQVVRFGAGGELGSILEAAGLTLPTEDALLLLHSAVNEAPPNNAALAIAQLYPRLAANPTANDLLLDLLPSAQLGGAAALALAAAGGPEVKEALARIAQDGDGPAAARARTALELVQGEGG